MKENKPLSPAMKSALERMKIGEPMSAYEIHASLSTLDALVERGYLKRKHEIGSSFFPHTNIIYTRIK